MNKMMSAAAAAAALTLTAACALAATADAKIVAPNTEKITAPFAGTLLPFDYETGDSRTAADRTVTVNGRSYTPGLVYRIVWADESHTAFTYDNADGGQRVGRSVSDSEFNALPYNATATGGFYYLKGSGVNDNFYGYGRFYTMVRDEGGFMYLRTVGDAILLLSEDVDGSDDSTAMRIKNNRLYFSTAEDYSGTGGTEYVDIVAIVIADGVEYRRTFRVAMIG